MRELTFKAAIASGAALIALAMSGNAQAQDTATRAENAKASEVPMGDIVVTARRKNESLMTTPVAVSAFNAEAIQKLGLSSLRDVAAFTPGLTISENFGNRQDRSTQSMIIRGMTPNWNGNVAVFMDGAPIVGSGFIEGVGDMARVEVIKGPQSATFGRSTFAGAINNVTKDPTPYLSGTVDAQIMSYGGHDVRIAVEGPLLKDSVSFRLSGRDYATAGSYVNSARPTERLGSQSTRSLSATLLIKPTPRLNIKLFGTYWMDDDGEGANYLVNSTALNCNAGKAGAGINYYCGQLPGVNLSALARNDQVDAAISNQLIHNVNGAIATIPGVSSDFLNHFGLHREAYHGHAILKYDVPSLNAQLSSISSYDNNRFEVITDLDGQDSTAFPNALYSASTANSVQSTLNTVGFVQYKNTGFSQELRLSGTGNGRLHWSVGGSYVEQHITTMAGGLLSFGAANFQTPAETQTRTAGAFFSLAYDLTDKLSVSAEGRYQQDRQQLHTLYNGDRTLARQAFTNFIPRVLVQYKPVRGVMAYASYSKGVNPGGFNSAVSGYSASTSAALQAQYGFGLNVKPETITNYELGVKGSFWGGRAQVIADVYYGVWTNQVVSNSYALNGIVGVTDGTSLSVYQNIGKTDLKGVELQFTLKPVAGLTLNGSYAYNESIIKQYVCTSCANYTGSTNVAGHSLANAPRNSGAFGAEYRQNISRKVEAYIRGDVTYTGKMYIDETNLAWIGDAARGNLRIGVEQAGDFRVEAFVNNITDNLAYTSGSRNSDYLRGYATAYSVGMPVRRTFGVRLRKTI
ncbi:MAG TPA: TonB-dependent receptor [Novosphingobium sp.]|nr:TonB-dependent receptor [Novosphingobium sp.]